MNQTASRPHEPPRVWRLKVRNFRALREVEIRNLTSMTAAQYLEPGFPVSSNQGQAA